MNRYQIALVVSITAFAACFALPASATPITGQAVDGFGGTTNIGTGADGYTDFYIPLNGPAETYDGSLTRDYCDASGAGMGTCTGGTIDIWVYFDAHWIGATTLTSWFYDFDVAEFNDPDFFFEVLELEGFDADGTLILSLTEAEVAALVTGDSDTQHLVLDIDTDGEFYVHMTFGTEFDPESTPNWRFGNTLESVKVTAVTVPEPGTLALLGAGLLLLAFSRRRKPEIRSPIED